MRPRLDSFEHSEPARHCFGPMRVMFVCGKPTLVNTREEFMAFTRVLKCLLGLSIVLLAVESSVAADAPVRLATFSADVTIPLDHRCMGVLPTKSKKIVDPLFSHGFLLLGRGKPTVTCALHWCQIRNVPLIARAHV